MTDRDKAFRAILIVALIVIAGLAVMIGTRGGMSSSYRRAGRQAYDALTLLQAQATAAQAAYDPRLKEAQKAVAEASRGASRDADKAAQSVLDTYLEAIQWARLSSGTLEYTKQGTYEQLIKKAQESHDLDVQTIDACQKEARQLFDKNAHKEDAVEGQCAAARRRVVDAIIKQ